MPVGCASPEPLSAVWGQCRAHRLLRHQGWPGSHRFSACSAPAVSSGNDSDTAGPPPHRARYGHSVSTCQIRSFLAGRMIRMPTTRSADLDRVGREDEPFRLSPQNVLAEFVSRERCYLRNTSPPNEIVFVIRLPNVHWPQRLVRARGRSRDNVQSKQPVRQEGSRAKPSSTLLMRGYSSRPLHLSAPLVGLRIPVGLIGVTG